MSGFGSCRGFDPFYPHLIVLHMCVFTSEVKDSTFHNSCILGDKPQEMRIERLKLSNIGIFDRLDLHWRSELESETAEIHILSGPNGSGKSTILYTLAAAFDGLQVKHFQTPYLRNQLVKRFRFFSGNHPEEERYSGATISFADGEKCDFYSCDKCHDLHPGSTPQYLGNYRSLASKDEAPTIPVRFAALAYSGYRYIASSQVDAIREIDINPLFGALEFVRTAKSGSDGSRSPVNQWIANLLSKRASASYDGNEELSKKFDASIVRLESAIGEIISKKVKFKMALEPKPELSLFLDEVQLDFDVLPDGLRSLLSWLADLLMRLERLVWEDDIALFERTFFLFLDEIEVHLHPKWQRAVLPTIAKLFPNAQIFLTTHSPFILNSVDNAWVYKLALQDGTSVIKEVYKTRTGRSFASAARDFLDVEERFGENTSHDLSAFYSIRDKLLTNGESDALWEELHRAAQSLEGDLETRTIVRLEMKQLEKILRDRND